MKKFFVVFVGLLGFATASNAQQVTLNIDAGLLKNSTGTAVVPNGMLLQLIASPSGTFSAPTSSSYITGDNILLRNFVMNSNSGIAGETLNGDTFNLSTANYTLTQGEAVILRFYPSLSGTTVPTTPTLGTSFGQVRSSTTEPGQNDSSQAPWVIPANGLSVDLLYITVADGGSYSDASAYATGIVGAVPEPSTTGMLGGITILFATLMKFRRWRA